MKQRVLLVDDEPGVRRMLSRLLEEEGYAVLPAADGSEALELAAGKGPHLVLLDLNLPGESGWTTFERLSASHPFLPVIIITARPNQIFPALAAGAGALMEKPLDLPKLLSTIQELLAEPAETRRARVAGRAAEFHYLPPKRQPPQATEGSLPQRPIWKNVSV
jgi:DNA-binding response OmpR family regulator